MRTKTLNPDDLAIGKFAVRVTEYLYDAHHVPDNSRRPTILTTGQLSKHDVRFGVHQITYTVRSLRLSNAFGFTEYTPVAKILGYDNCRPTKGIRAIYLLVMHEFAHVLQRDAGERKYRSAHNPMFAMRLRLLMAHYPYDAIMKWYDQSTTSAVPVATTA